VITENDLHEAIAECYGQRNPNANTCVKLASFLTILDHLQKEQEEPVRSGYSYDPPEKIAYYSDTEFGQAVSGMQADDVMQIMDELLETLRLMHPKLYHAFMRKITGSN